MAFGALVGGGLIKDGRKRIVVIFNAVGIIGCLISLVLNFPIMCIGRLIFGFASGVLVIATPKILDETIPAHLMDNGYGVSTNLAINSFVLVNLLLGIGMPTDQS